MISPGRGDARFDAVPLPSPHGRGRVGFPLLLVPALLFVGCVPPPQPPSPPPCDQPVPIVDPVWTWTGDQVKLSWPDMPVEVCGGNEAWVLNRRSILDLPEGRTLVGGSTFLGFDMGNRVEADFHVYDHAGRLLYSRSPHYHGGCENPDCYDARESFQVLDPQPISRLTVDTTCRVVGTNAQGNLTANCHHEATFQFGDGVPPTPPPGPGCQITPGEPSAPWLPPVPPSQRAPQKGDALQAAKILVGDRCGQDPHETLRLLAAALVEAGECSEGPWGKATGHGDAVVIIGNDGAHEEWHAVAFTDGCYTPGGKYKNAWFLGTVPPPPNTCGPPRPPALHHINLKPGNPWASGTPLVGPDRDYCASVGFTDGRSFCSVRPDCDPATQNCPFPDRAACEELVMGGDPLWRSDGRIIVKGDNPYNARCCLPGNTGAKCQGAPVCTYLEMCNAAGLICDRIAQ